MITDDQGKLILHPKTCSNECKRRLLGPHIVHDYCDSYVIVSSRTSVRTFVDGRFAFVTCWGSGTDDYFCKHVYGAPSILFAKCAVCSGGMSNIDHVIKTGQVACKTFQKQVLPFQLIGEIKRSYMPWLITRQFPHFVYSRYRSDNDIREFVAQTCTKSRRPYEQQLVKRRRKHQCITTTNMWNMDLISAINDMIISLSDDE